MSLFKTALEECNSCGTSAGKSGLQQTHSGFQTNAKQGDAFTYDDNKGVKDSVILTGPLSEVYTKALNISLKKQSLTKPEETGVEFEEDGVDFSRVSAGTLSNEDMKEDDTLLILKSINDQLTREESKNADDNYEFTTLSNDPANVVANIAVMTVNDAVDPVTVDSLHDYQDTHSGQDTILVVTVPTNTGSEGTRVQHKLINLNTNAHVLGEDCEAAQTALENLYEKRGIRVFYGVEGLVQAVRLLNGKT